MSIRPNACEDPGCEFVALSGERYCGLHYNTRPTLKIVGVRTGRTSMRGDFDKPSERVCSECGMPKKNVKRLPQQDREYLFFFDKSAVVKNVVQLVIYPTGCHELTTASGEVRVIPPWWYDMKIDVVTDFAKAERQVAESYLGDYLT